MRLMREKGDYHKKCRLQTMMLRKWKSFRKVDWFLLFKAKKSNSYLTVRVLAALLVEDLILFTFPKAKQ
jgi:hypothetical protein